MSLQENPKIILDLIQIERMNGSDFHQGMVIPRSPKACVNDVPQQTINFVQTWLEMQHVLGRPKDAKQRVAIIQ